MSNYSDAVNALTPLAYWRLGELSGETVAVDETDNYDGSYVGIPALETEGLLINDIDTSVSLDGNDDYMYHVGSISITTEMSVSLIFSVAFFTEINDLISIYNTNTDRIIIQTNTNGTLRIWKDSAELWSSSEVLETDTKYHLVITDDGVDTKIYLDSVELSTSTTPTLTTLSSTTFNSLGVRFYDNVAQSRKSQGIYDEFALFPISLTQTNVTNLYNISQGYVDFPANYKETVLHYLPTAYWRLGESSGVTAFDVMGNYDGTYVNTPTLGVSGLLTNDVDTAVDFDGTDDFVNCGNTLRFIDGTDDLPFSFSVIARPTVFGSRRGGLVSKWRSATVDAEYQMSFTTDGGIQFQLLSANTNNRIRITTNNVFSINENYHITFTYDGSKTIGGMNIYVDSELQNVTVFQEGTYTGMYVASGTISVDIGTTLKDDATYSRDFEGVIDEVSCWSLELSQADINILYNAYQGFFLATQSFNITIDHTKVDEDLYDFPLLVNLGASSGIDAYDSSAIFDVLADDSLVLIQSDQLTSDSNIVDTSPYNAPLTIVLAQHSQDQKKIGDSSIYFGNNESVSGDFPYALGTDPFTIDFWYYPELSSNQIIFITSSSVATTYIGIQNYNGSIYLYHGSTSFVDTGADFTPTAWQHIAIVLDGAGNIELYKDGVSVFSSATLYVGVDTGYRLGNTYGGLGDLYGYVDEFRISKGAQWTADFTPNIVHYATKASKLLNAIYINPADNIISDYRSAVLNVDPIAYWRLGESFGAITAIDEIGAYNGAYINGVTLGVDGLLNNDDNTSASFNGIDQRVDLDNIVSELSTHTVGSVGFLAELKFTGDATRVSISLSIANSPYFQFILNETAVTISMALGLNQTWKVEQSFSLNTVYNIIVTTDPVEYFKVYINGVLYIPIIVSGVAANAWFKDASDASGGVDSFSIMSLYRNDVIYDKAIIDEVFITDYQLTAYQCSQLNDSALVSTPSDSTVYSRQCKVEIDRWDGGNKEAQLWIKVPYISKDVDTIINLSYDVTNPDNSDNIGYTGELPAQAVWSEYDAVYHLSKDGADSTVNALNGTLVGIDDTNIVDFGIGKGLSFNGIDEFVNIADDPAIRFDNGDMELSFKYSRVAGSVSEAIFSKRLNSSPYTQYSASINNHPINSTDGDQLSFLNLDDLSNYRSEITDSSYNDGLIHDVVISYVGATGVTAIYIDGVEVSITSTAVGLLPDSDNAVNLYIGNSSANNYFTGLIKGCKLSRTLKSPGWIGTNYDSTQDTLVRYSGADSYELARSIIGLITENVAVVDWVIRAYRLDTGVLTAELKTIAGAFQLPIPNGQWFPTMVTVVPEQGVSWVGNTAQLVDDLVFPTDPETTPYYFKCTVSGTGIDGVTGLTEPTWPTVPGQTVVDGTVTWEVVERMIQPITHSPMIPK